MTSVFRIPKVQFLITLFLIFLTALANQPSFEAVRIVTLSLFFTVASDLFFTFLRKRELFVPYAALVTGLIISLTINLRLPWYDILLITSISMGTKNFLRITNRHIFNPAGIGLVVGGILLRQNVSWWGTSSQTILPFGVKHALFFLVLLLPSLISGYRMRRYGSILSFLITYTLLLLFMNHFNFRVLQTTLFDPTVLFFSIVMLPEPMTSPVKLKKQIPYGIFVAMTAILVSSSFVGAILTSHHLLPDGLLPFLLVGNMVFFELKNTLDLVKFHMYHKNMNNKWFIRIVIALIVIGGIFIFNKNYSPSLPTTLTPTQTKTQPSTAISGSLTTTNQQNIITLTQDGFLPATLTVKTGITVAWENKSGVDATVDSDPHPTHTNYPVLNLGALPDGGKLSLVFDKPGTYGYHNHLNPSQTGTIVVQ